MPPAEAPKNENGPITWAICKTRFQFSYAVLRALVLLTMGAGFAEIGFIIESFTSNVSTLRCSLGRE